MGLDDLLGDRQSQAGTDDGLSRDAIEAFEDAHAVLNGNAAAIVGDLKYHCFIAPVGSDMHLPAVRSVLEGIAKKVSEDMGNSYAIGMHLWKVAWYADVEDNACVSVGRSNGSYSLIHQNLWINRLQIEQGTT